MVLLSLYFLNIFGLISLSFTAVAASVYDCRMSFHNNNNNNDRLTAFDPGQPG